MIEALAGFAAAFGVATAVAVCVLAARRIVLARAERRRSATEERLRPLAYGLLEGDAIDVGELSDGEVQVLAALLRRYGRTVRGDDTARIAAFFEANGWTARHVAALRHRKAWQRATAAFALGDMGSPLAVPALIEALSDESPEVCAAAARSVGVLGAAAAVEELVYALAAHRIPRSVAGQALLSIGDAALPALRRLETTADPDARALAVELVGLLGTAADADRLVERLRDSSAEVRAKAARALGRLGAQAGTAALREALSDRIPFVRVAAATALAAVGDVDAVPDLVRIARTDSFDAARAAAMTVAALASPTAVGDLDGSPHLQEAFDLAAVSR